MRKGIYILFVCIFSLSFIGCKEEDEEFIGERGKMEIADNIKLNNEKNLSLLKEEIGEMERRLERKNIEKKGTIVIDPGHSSSGNGETEQVTPGRSERKLKDTSGGVSRALKVPEYVVTHRVANKLKDALDNEGYNVILTKSNERESMSNIERANVGNNNNADLMIRLHLDSAESEEASGGSILVPEALGYMTGENKILSRKYGEIIFNNYIEQTGLRSRGVIIRNDLTGFNWSKVPVVLLEMGFFSNREEEKFFLNEDNDKKIVSGIVKGIKEIKFR